MMEGLTIGSTFLAAASSALAAYFWYHAAQLDAGANVDASASPLIEYARESGRRNKMAASWSAAAAAFAGIGWVMGLLTPTI